MQVARLGTGSSSTSGPRPQQDEAGPPRAGRYAVGDTAKVGSYGRQRDAGSAIFLGSRLSSSRPPGLGRRFAPSLRDGFASPDQRPLTGEISAAAMTGNQAPEPGREHDVAIAVTSMNGGQLMTRLPESTARRYGKVFDEIAAEYDRHRPAYPDELLDEAGQVAGIGRGDHVLEVGCGTGQLTRGLAARGLRVTALEPGKSLIALARQNLEGAGEVEFVNAQFEDASLPREHFRAVFSASAFHWIDPKVSWQKAAEVLVPGGTLALVQYCGLEEPRSKRDQEAALAAIRKVAPDIAANWPAYRDLDATVAGLEQRRGNVSEAWAWLGSYDIGQDYAGRLFGDVQVAVMPKLVEHTPDELNALLRTMSFYARISTAQRQALEREYEAIYERLGRPIRASTVAALVTARRS
jgi:ubiquinone/menaquinone biosynthesis C-methylase UbiE